MTSNSTKKSVKLLTLLRRAEFVYGFNERRAGKPFDPEKYTDARDQWTYERGRQLAVVYHGPLKNGRTVCNEAALAYQSEVKMGGINR